MTTFSIYKKNFPEFQNYLDHDSAKGCIKEMSKEKKGKIVFKFFKEIYHSNWKTDAHIKSLADAALSAINKGKAKVSKKHKKEFKSLKKAYESQVSEKEKSVKTAHKTDTKIKDSTKEEKLRREQEEIERLHKERMEQQQAQFRREQQERDERFRKEQERLRQEREERRQEFERAQEKRRQEFKDAREKFWQQFSSTFPEFTNFSGFGFSRPTESFGFGQREAPRYEYQSRSQEQERFRQEQERRNRFEEETLRRLREERLQREAQERAHSIKLPDELQRNATYKDNSDFQALFKVYKELGKEQRNISQESAQDHFKKIFNVTSLAEIKSHYKKLILILHKDKTAHLQEGSRAFLEELFKFLTHYYTLATRE